MITRPGSHRYEIVALPRNRGLRRRPPETSSASNEHSSLVFHVTESTRFFVTPSSGPMCTRYMGTAWGTRSWGDTAPGPARGCLAPPRPSTTRLACGWRGGRGRESCLRAFLPSAPDLGTWQLSSNYSLGRTPSDAGRWRHGHHQPQQNGGGQAVHSPALPRRGSSGSAHEPHRCRLGRPRGCGSVCLN